MFLPGACVNVIFMELAQAQFRQAHANQRQGVVRTSTTPFVSGQVALLLVVWLVVWLMLLLQPPLMVLVPLPPPCGRSPPRS